MSQQILAIDDSPEIHRLLHARLGNLDVVIEHATNVREGLALAQAECPDLILLDVHMPDGNGFDACRQLKADPNTTAIPVIFLTGASTVEEKVLGFDVGAVDYIQKPFEAAELKARVRSALRTKRYFDMLNQRAMIDGLTGLWNRNQFEQRLHEEIESAARYDRPLSLIMTDIDRFKMLNDQHGHPFGDEVLQAIGEKLQEGCRVADWPCRYGGEEFAIILRETDLEGAVNVGERIRKSIESLRLKNQRRSVQVTTSLGVSSTSLCRDPSMLTRKWLLKNADQALYEAKQNGRNRLVTGAAE